MRYINGKHLSFFIFLLLIGIIFQYSDYSKKIKSMQLNRPSDYYTILSEWSLLMQWKQIDKPFVLFIGDDNIDLMDTNIINKEDLPIFNMGLAGITTSKFLEFINKSDNNFNCSKVFIHIGLNDCFYIENFSEKKWIEDLDKIIDFFIQKNYQIFISTLLPVSSDMLLVVNKDRITWMNNIIKSKKQKDNIIIVDSSSLYSDEYGNLWKQFTEDGIHLNSEGLILWKQYIQSVL